MTTELPYVGLWKVHVEIKIMSLDSKALTCTSKHNAKCQQSVEWVVEMREGRIVYHSYWLFR